MGSTPEAEPSNPLAKGLRDAATRQSDRSEADSLIQSAETLETADRQLQEARARLVASIAEAKATANAIRRRDGLPWWAVAMVLVAFFAFLAFVAVKHYV